MSKSQVWNKGLTKHNSEIVKLMIENAKKAFSKIDCSERSKKAWETKRKNGTDHICGIKKGYKRSEEAKQKVREGALNRVKRDGKFCSIGKHEKRLLDIYEQKDNCKIDREFEIIGYKPDGYCHETNTIYEVYEKRHDLHVEHDEIRIKRIYDVLKCNFMIVYDRL